MKAEEVLALVSGRVDEELLLRNELSLAGDPGASQPARLSPRGSPRAHSKRVSIPQPLSTTSSCHSGVPPVAPIA